MSIHKTCLLDVPVKRITPKSQFLIDLEEKQQKARDAELARCQKIYQLHSTLVGVRK